ncbi:PREDICTED: uncharacterized protein LOC100633737 [Amphimedon queenslandica]|nr:PREDICTED: uncharacterized protein LOC100633737 [Amphimedon queenslandica]|eukprot:XP_019859965.1 PREDICTED: uncharacterized protein LOC100633737 [Amphimedon queenslandica]
METESLKGDKIILPTDMRGTPALILIFMKAHGLKMSERYRIPFIENFGGSIPVYEVNVLELIFLRLLRRFLQANLRQQIEARRHEHFLCHYGNFYGIKNRLDIHSSMVSHAFLLDNKGWVRWRCHGYPTGQEIQYLMKCTKDLLLISKEEHKQ